MALITFEIEDDVAAALSQQSQISHVSPQLIGQAVLEQWFLDQRHVSDVAWSEVDIAAIEDGRAQSASGETITHEEARTRLISRAM